MTAPNADKKINVVFVYPPVPTRAWDWQATRDGYEPGDPVGQGPTREAAIADLLLWEECRESEIPETIDG